jgi:hypothetical protein
VVFRKIMACVQVSIERIITMGTNKKTFGTRTLATTLATGLGSHVRTDLDNFNTLPNGFVGDERLQLKKAPSIQPEVEFLTFSFSPDILEVFQHDSSCTAIINYCFAYDMVPISLETSLPARNFLQQFLGTSSAFALEPCSQMLEFEAVAFNLATAEELFVACDSNMIYADINTNLKSVRNLVSVDVSSKCDMTKQPVKLVNCYSHSLRIPIQILPEIFWNLNRQVYPASGGCHSYLVRAKSESSFVKIKRHELFELRLRTFIGLDGFKGLAGYPVRIYYELRRQLEFASGRIIAKLVKPVPVTHAKRVPFITDIRDGFRILFHHVKKQFVHRNLYLDCGDRLHILYVNKEAYINLSEVKFAFLPQLKQWVSCEHVA